MGGIEITAKNPPTDRRDCGGKRREGEITDTPEPREQEGIAFFGIAVMLITLVSWDNWTEREEEGSRGIASISVSSSFDTFYSFSRSMINDRCKWWNTLHYCFHYPRVVIFLFLLFIFFSFIAINMAVSWVIFFSILNGACEAGSWSTIRIIFYNSFEDVWTIGYEAWITPLYLYVYINVYAFFIFCTSIFLCVNFVSAAIRKYMIKWIITYHIDFRISVEINGNQANISSHLHDITTFYIFIIWKIPCNISTSYRNFRKKIYRDYRGRIIKKKKKTISHFPLN